YAEKEITCQSATNQDMRWLDMKGFNMVVNVESFTYLDDARVFQYTSSRHRPDKFVFRDFARRNPKA
ncbi:MAG: UTRA domain-containing protein, partial [Lactimicrobium massiliense]